MRARLERQRGVHISDPAHFGGNLNFTRAADKQRYATCCERRITPYRYRNAATLDLLNIRVDFDRLIRAIGWRPYTYIVDRPAFVELVREFYAIFEFDLPTGYTVSTPNVIRFRLMGQEFHHSITDFNLALGFIDQAYVESREYTESAYDYVQPFFSHYRHIWEEMSMDRNNYDPRLSKGSYLKDPASRYIHRFLAYSFSGRRDSSGILSKSKFFFIWCMHNNIKVNLGCWLTSQFKSILPKKKRPLILGSYTTHLAVNLHVLDLSNHDLHVACQMEPLDILYLEKIGLVREGNDGWEVGASRRPPLGHLLPAPPLMAVIPAPLLPLRLLPPQGLTTGSNSGTRLRDWRLE
ncbi:uncharacterized protein [Coffea arabica]|uniref:Uncharacterized protein LOC113703750 n=1 Tax=Coffea arabica TaxID=13443 RepID=A0A6P6TSA7_COFAR|nr:uncharacterized protein LOC113703750 [Coffea arabica]XP_027081030.1 uncharacterized protein LOC113703750 [Coffea arabica]